MLDCDASRRGMIDFVITFTALFVVDLLDRGSQMVVRASLSRSLPSPSLDAVAASFWLLSNFALPLVVRVVSRGAPVLASTR